MKIYKYPCNSWTIHPLFSMVLEVQRATDDARNAARQAFGFNTFTSYGPPSPAFSRERARFAARQGRRALSFQRALDRIAGRGE